MKHFERRARADSEKVFTFDYSYWSHDADDASYANQQKVFQDLGVGILKNAWEGLRVSVLSAE